MISFSSNIEDEAEIEELAKDQARREAYFAREQAIAETQEERNLKVEKQSPG